MTLGWLWWRAWGPLVARWRRGTVRSRRGTWRHLPSFCLAGVWHLVTSTFHLHGRHGTWSHRPSLCLACLTCWHVWWKLWPNILACLQRRLVWAMLSYVLLQAMFDPCLAAPAILDPYFFTITMRFASTRCRTQRRNRLTSKRSKPHPPHTGGTPHRRLQPLYTEKRSVSCSGFLTKTSPMQHSCSH